MEVLKPWSAVGRRSCRHGMIQDFLFKEAYHAAAKALRSTEQDVSSHSVVRVNCMITSLHQLRIHSDLRC